MTEIQILTRIELKNNSNPFQLSIELKEKVKVTSKLEHIENNVFSTLAKCFGRLFCKLNIGESEMDGKIKQIDDLICKASIRDTTFEKVHEQMWESSLSDIESEMWEMYQLLRTIRDIVKGAK